MTSDTNLSFTQTSITGNASAPGGIAINNRHLNIGDYFIGYARTETLRMSSGTVSVNNNLVFGANYGIGKGIIAGGLITAKTVSVGSDASGTVTMSDGTVNVSNTVFIGKSSGVGTLILTGGTINAGAVELGNDDGMGIMKNSGGLISTNSVTATQSTDAFIFNGGILQAKSNNAHFISGFSRGQLFLEAAGGIIDTNGFRIGITSEMSGPGGLTVIGPGTLTLTGSNIYSGTTSINAGVLSLGANNAFSPDSDVYIASNGTMDLGGFNGTIGSLQGIGGSTVTNNGGAATLSIGATNNSAIFAGTIQDGRAPLSIIKMGSGREILTGNNTYTGSTLIQSGELTVNGQLASPNVLIQPGGVLSGIGTLAGNVLNSGVVSPGNGIGPLTIKGNYTQTIEGTQLTELSCTHSDLLAVGGSANLDGRLYVLPLSAPTSEGYKILTASDGVKGTFSEVSTPEDLLVEVLYDPTEVWVLVLGVGKPMRMIALEKFTPRIAGNIKDVLFNVTNAQYGQLTTRLAAIRSGVQGITLQGLSQEPMVQQYSKRALPPDKQILKPISEELNWDIWTSASGVFSKINNVRDLPSTNSITGLFMLGADHRINKIVNVGVYAGYQSTWARQSNARLRSNGVKFGLYGTAQWKGFYLNGIVGGGANSFNIKHSFDYAKRPWTTRGNPFAGELDSLLGAGYEHRVGPWKFGVNNSVQYTYVGVSAFTQNTGDHKTRNLNVRVGSQNPSSLVYTLGGNVSYLWQIASNYQILPTLGMYWQHEFLNYGQRIGSRLANGKGVPFYFQSQSGARNNAFGVAGITAQIGSRLGAFVHYTPQFGGAQLYSNAILVGLNFNF